MFEQFLLRLHLFLGSDQIQMCEHPHNTGHSVCLADVQKFERVHLKAVVGVDQEKNLKYALSSHITKQKT